VGPPFVHNAPGAATRSATPRGRLQQLTTSRYFDASITELWRAALGSYQMLTVGVAWCRRGQLRFRTPARFDDHCVDVA